jgi:hypothetical protein
MWWIVGEMVDRGDESPRYDGTKPAFAGCEAGFFQIGGSRGRAHRETTFADAT